MSLAEACLWSLGRALVIATIGLPVCFLLAGQLRRAGRTRIWWLGGLLLPFLMPELLVGFVYSDVTLRLVQEIAPDVAAVPRPSGPIAPQTAPVRAWSVADLFTELLYGLLLACRVLPVGAVVLWLTPPPLLSREAIHARRLALRLDASIGQRLLTTLETALRGPLRAGLPAFGVMFLLAFQEFEMAALMQVSRYPAAWTVWLFDSHAGGLPLSESLGLTVWPIVCELCVLTPILYLLLRGEWAEAGGVVAISPRSRSAGATALAVTLIAALLVCLGPVAALLAELRPGLRVLSDQRTIRNDFAEGLIVSAVFGLAAALSAYWLAGLLVRARRWWLASAMILPGLIGSLVLSLLVLWLFQLRLFSPAYDTPAPMLLGLVVFLLPRAVLLRLVLEVRAPQQPVHAARLLLGARQAERVTRARRLLWVLLERPAFWTVALLAYWGYWNLTVAAILRPLQLEPFVPGLYNFMHYGRNETLSAVALLAAVFPLAVSGLVVLAYRLTPRITGRR